MSGIRNRFRAFAAALGLVATCTGCSGEPDDEEKKGAALAAPSEELLAELIDGAARPSPVVLERFATDAPPPVHDAFFADLPDLVERLPLLERRRVLQRWAADEHVELRAAAGRALQSSFVALGAHDLVSALAADPDADVRKHGALAAMIRRVPLTARAG